MPGVAVLDAEGWQVGWLMVDEDIYEALRDGRMAAVQVHVGTELDVAWPPRRVPIFAHVVTLYRRIWAMSETTVRICADGRAWYDSARELDFVGMHAPRELAVRPRAADGERFEFPATERLALTARDPTMFLLLARSQVFRSL